MSWLPVWMIALPLLGAAPAWALGRKEPKQGYGLMIGIAALVTGAALWMLVSGTQTTFSLPGVMGLGLNLKADGFRGLYAAVAAFMWLMTGLFTPQYLAHGHSRARYMLYTLLTMGATVGVFLSDDLITCFLFFEIMSFTSYCWVAHEQTPGALRAGQTYLAIAVLGGMAMLMGLMMLFSRLGTLRFDRLGELAAEGADSLYLPGALILVGFGAKAGMYPLHVWLPKAHPVAPAPASALLSGVLTKVGIFGILVISSRLFFGDLLWGNVLLGIGLINMLLGALLALFSVDLKRTLACSSMSQIGFILFGIGMQSLLGDHNAIAAQGTVLHMLNHSLIKLCLFMAAGVVYIHLHQLNLNDIRGFGRGKWGFMACFLAGAASISGIPLFSGYASKTLLHEAIVEYIDHLRHLGEGAGWYVAAEWVFIITGGLTFCYMLKLFIAIFVEKHPTRQAEFQRLKPLLSLPSWLALGGAALAVFLLGLWPEGTMAPLANTTVSFMGARAPEHAVVFLAPVNVIGGAKSLAIGLALYATVVRRWLMRKDPAGALEYVDRWPPRLDLENGLYRPVVHTVSRLGILAATPFDRLVDGALFPFVNASGTFFARLFETLVEGTTVLMMRTVFRRPRARVPVVPVGNRFTFTLGMAADRLSNGVLRLAGKGAKAGHKYIYMFAAWWNAIHDNGRRMFRSLTFSLMLFAVGLVALLAFLMIR